MAALEKELDLLIRENSSNLVEEFIKQKEKEFYFNNHEIFSTQVFKLYMLNNFIREKLNIIFYLLTKLLQILAIKIKKILELNLKKVFFIPNFDHLLKRLRME